MKLQRYSNLTLHFYLTNEDFYCSNEGYFFSFPWTGGFPPKTVFHNNHFYCHKGFMLSFFDCLHKTELV